MKGEITHFCVADGGFSLASLPVSEVVLEAPALALPPSPSCPRRMIFLGNATGGGVLAFDAFGRGLISASEGGTLQKGVLNMRTDPMFGSKEWVIW